MPRPAAVSLQLHAKPTLPRSRTPHCRTIIAKPTREQTKKTKAQTKTQNKNKTHTAVQLCLPQSGRGREEMCHLWYSSNDVCSRHREETCIEMCYLWCPFNDVCTRSFASRPLARARAVDRTVSAVSLGRNQGTASRGFFAIRNRWREHAYVGTAF